MRNSEGYSDPTMCEAINNVAREEKAVKKKAREQKIVYVCSPFSDDIQGNTEKARKYCRFAVDKGCVPIAPHLLFPQFMSEETERDRAMEMNTALIYRCDEVWVFGSRITRGMKAEISNGNLMGKRIRYFKTEVSHEDQDSSMYQENR